MEKNNKKTEVTEINTAAKKTETTAKQTAESAPSLDKVVKKSLKMQHNTKEAAKDKPAASANEELKNYIGTEFPVTVPDKITQDEPFDVFSGNPELRRYADSVLGKTAYLKIWPEMNARGEIRIGFRYRGVSASEITMKYRNREKIIGNNTCLSFLKNYKRVDAFMLKGLYHVLSEIIPKIDEITTISDDDMGLEETYARIILMGEKVVSDDHTITQEIKTASEKGKKYLCFCGKTALEKMLKDVGASMKRREFLSLLKYPEEGNSLLLVDDGRCYDHRGGGDYDHWYYIRVDDSIIKKYRKANEEA